MPLLKRLAPFFALTLVIFTVNFCVGASHGVVKSYHGGPGTTLLTMTCVIADYVKGIFFPADLSAKYLVGFVPSPLSAQFLSALCVILAAALAILSSRSRMAALGAAWFLIALLPFLNIIPISTLRADRYVYVGMIGAGLVIAGALATVRDARVRMALSALPLVFLAVLSWQRAHIWTGSLPLWRDTVAKSPLSPMAHANLGAAFLARGQKALAEAQFEHALACDPGCAIALTNLSQIWRDAGRKSDALRAAQRAVKADPGSADARLNLGVLQADAGDLDQAYLSFGQAADRDPYLAEAYYNMAHVRELRKRPDDAIRLYTKAVSVQPLFADAYMPLGVLLAQAGRIEEAMERFQRLCELRPNDREAHYNLALACLRAHQFDRAESAAEKSLRLGFAPAQDLLRQIQAKNTQPRPTPGK